MPSPKRKSVRRAWELDRDGTWPQQIIDDAFALGLMNSHVPSEYGGVGVIARETLVARRVEEPVVERRLAAAA